MKHEIEIPDLPEGWDPVEILIDPDQYNKYVGDDGCLYWDAKIRMKKKQPPRRIVLEETGQVRKPMEGEYVQNNGNYCLCRKPERWGNEHEIWKIVEDNKCEE